MEPMNSFGHYNFAEDSNLFPLTTNAEIVKNQSQQHALLFKNLNHEKYILPSRKM